MLPDLSSLRRTPDFRFSNLDSRQLYKGNNQDFTDDDSSEDDQCIPSEPLRTYGTFPQVETFIQLNPEIQSRRKTSPSSRPGLRKDHAEFADKLDQLADQSYQKINTS